MNIRNTLHYAGTTVFGALTAFFTTVPDAAMQVWQSSPALVKALVPEPYIPIVTAALTLLCLVSKEIKRNKKPDVKDGGVNG